MREEQEEFRASESFADAAAAAYGIVIMVLFVDLKSTYCFGSLTKFQVSGWK